MSTTGRAAPTRRGCQTALTLPPPRPPPPREGVARRVRALRKTADGFLRMEKACRRTAKIRDTPHPTMRARAGLRRPRSTQHSRGSSSAAGRGSHDRLLGVLIGTRSVVRNALRGGRASNVQVPPGGVDGLSGVCSRIVHGPVDLS
jgi:hypothetical protein